MSLAGITGSSLSAPAIYPFTTLLVCFNVVDIWAKVLFKEGLKEKSEGSLGCVQGTPPMAENDSSGLKAYQVVDCRPAAGVVRVGSKPSRTE